MEPHQVPPTLIALRSRAQEVPEWLLEAEGQLLRWYRECDETAGRVAVRSLERIRSRTNSSDPLLLAWLGVALVRGPEVQVPRAEGSFLRPMHQSSNSERDGARLLARVTESSDWPEVAEELAAVAVATRKDETLRLASRTLWNVVEGRNEAALWSALAEVELVREDGDAAERAAARAASAGSPRGLRVAGILRMQAGNDAEGAESYLRGLGLALEESDVQPFFDDVRVLLGDDELAQWRALGTGRSEWIRRKWEWRAHMAGARLGERLGVNARRMKEALNRFARLSFRGPAGANPQWNYSVASRPLPFDDRGTVYLRHGEPAAELGRRGQRLAWIYGGPATKPMAFEFADGRPDYFLALPPPCNPTSGATPRPTPVPSDYALDLTTWLPALAWYYIRCETVPEIAIAGYADAREMARLDAEAGLSSESGVLGLDRPLTTAWNIYAFQTARSPELVTYLAVQTAGLRSAERDGTRIDLDLLLSVGDPVAETSAQLDTTLSYRSVTPLPAGALLHWALALRVTAQDNARIVLTVRNRADERQGRIAATTWRVPTFDGTLLLSDLVIAEPRTGVMYRGTHRIAPALGHAVFENSPFRLYYELYGAGAGEPLSFTIRVLPGRNESLLQRLQSLISRRNALSVEFAGQAAPDADGVLRVEQDLQADLEPGAYSVVVTIHNADTGANVTRDTNLLVLAR